MVTRSRVTQLGWAASRPGAASPDSVELAGPCGEPLLSVEQVATLLNVSNAWVYDRARSGEIPSGYFGKHLRFRAADIDAYIERAFARNR